MHSALSRLISAPVSINSSAELATVVLKPKFILMELLIGIKGTRTLRFDFLLNCRAHRLLLRFGERFPRWSPPALQRFPTRKYYRLARTI